MSESRNRTGKVLRWIGRIIYLFVFIFISFIHPHIKWQLPSVKLSEEIEINSFSTLTDLADEYVDKHTIGIYKLSYLSLEHDKALHKCVAVDFEYSHAFLKYSCRISFNPVTGEMVGTWSNQKVFKNKLNMSTWNLQLENMIKVSNMEWSSFTITAISYSIQYEGNHDYIEVEYYNGEKRVSLLGFRADDVPYWLR